MPVVEPCLGDTRWVRWNPNGGLVSCCGAEHLHAKAVMPGKECLDPAELVLHLALREWKVMPGHLLLQGIDYIGIDCMANKHTMQVIAPSSDGSPSLATA